MIHPSSHIDPAARIHPSVEVGPFVSISGDVEIGEGSWLGPNCVIQDGSRIGKNVRIFPGAVISSIPQDLKFNGEMTTVQIGDGSTIREFVTINRGTVHRKTTTIGKDSLIMAYSHIAHDCVIGNNVVIANTTNLAGHVVIEDFSILGGMCGVHQFVRIGKNVMIQGGALLLKDVPPYTKAGRFPISFMGVNTIGLKRHEFSSETIEDIQEVYRIIYLSGMNTTQATEYIGQNIPQSRERDEILTFIRTSERGIMKGYAPVHNE